MNIGVISDTHRNIEFMRRAVDWLVQRRRITGLYHLGDDFDDVAELAGSNIDIVQVPGIYDSRYLDGSLPATARDNVYGLQIIIVHSIDKDLSRENRYSADIILHGHTHHAGLLLEDGRFLMNPGHLKGEKDKNMPATFGLLEITEKEVNATVFNLGFTPVHAMRLMRAENGLYRG